MSIKKAFDFAVSQLERSRGVGIKDTRRGFFAKVGAALASVPILSTGSTRAYAWNDGEDDGPLVIAKQGSFMAGGSVLQTPGVFNPLVTGGPGQTLHGDHVYAQCKRDPTAAFRGELGSVRCPPVIWWTPDDDGRIEVGGAEWRAYEGAHCEGGRGAWRNGSGLWTRLWRRALRSQAWRGRTA